eukprot:gene7278-biopygen1175
MRSTAGIIKHAPKRHDTSQTPTADSPADIAKASCRLTTIAKVKPYIETSPAHREGQVDPPPCARHKQVLHFTGSDDKHATHHETCTQLLEFFWSASALFHRLSALYHLPPSVRHGDIATCATTRDLCDLVRPAATTATCCNLCDLVRPAATPATCCDLLRPLRPAARPAFAASWQACS